jgi:hypothetical protein
VLTSIQRKYNYLAFLCEEGYQAFGFLLVVVPELKAIRQSTNILFSMLDVS